MPNERKHKESPRLEGGGELGAGFLAAAEAARESHALAAASTELRNQEIRKMSALGASARSISRAVGMSPQGVINVLNK